jgi:sialic acid synthase SpsE
MNSNRTPEFQIQNRKISKSEPTYFIADLAANHDGSLARAKELIRLAAAAGADAVKFQHFRAEHIVSRSGFEELGGKLGHQQGWTKSVFDVYKDASIDWSWTEELKETSDSCGVEFMTSPYDFEAVDHIDPFVNCFKIGSGDITWLEIIDHIASKGKPVILATGASTLEDVVKAVSVIENRGVPHAILQCNTNYTGASSNVSFINLNVLETFSSKFPNAILGLSDHTHGDVTVLGAVAKGARVVEKHFTDDNERGGPDHAFSMNPTTWSEMVSRTRDLESSLGTGEKLIEKNELETVVLQRRSLRFSRDLAAGHLVTRDDLSVVRPCPEGALRPEDYLNVVGKTLNTNVISDNLVRMSMFVD